MMVAGTMAARLRSAGVPVVAPPGAGIGGNLDLEPGTGAGGSGSGSDPGVWLVRRPPGLLTPVPRITGYKYLGAWLTADRSARGWDAHLQRRKAAADKAFWAQSAVLRERRLPLRLRLFTLTGVVQPVLTHAAQVWARPTVERRAELDSWQAGLVARMTGCPPNVSHACLQQELGITPLHVVCDTLMLRYWHRLRALPADRLLRRVADAWPATPWWKGVGGLLQDYGVDVVATAGMSRNEFAAHLCDLAGDHIDGAWEAAAGRGSVARRYREAFGSGVFSTRSFTRRAGPRAPGESVAQQAERERCPCCAARAPESAAHFLFECGAPGRPARLAALLADLGASGGGVHAGALAAHLRTAGVALAASGSQELEAGAGGGGSGSVSDPGVVAGAAAPRAADAGAAVSISDSGVAADTAAPRAAGIGAAVSVSSVAAAPAAPRAPRAAPQEVNALDGEASWGVACGALCNGPGARFAQPPARGAPGSEGVQSGFPNLLGGRGGARPARAWAWRRPAAMRAAAALAACCCCCLAAAAAAAAAAATAPWAGDLEGPEQLAAYVAGLHANSTVLPASLLAEPALGLRGRALLAAAQDVGAWQAKGRYVVIQNPSMPDRRSSTGQVAIHSVLLPGSYRILLFGRNLPKAGPKSTPEPRVGGNVSTVYDVRTGDYVVTPNYETLFCAGHTTLSDGTVVAAGGDMGFGYDWMREGRDVVRLFHPDTNTWETLPGVKLSEFRWYPTQVNLPDDRVIIVSGFLDDPARQTGKPAPSIDVYDHKSRSIVLRRSRYELGKSFFTNITPGYQLYPAVFLINWVDPAKPDDYFLFMYTCRTGQVVRFTSGGDFVPLRNLPGLPIENLCTSFSAMGSAAVLPLKPKSDYAFEVAIFGGGTQGKGMDCKGVCNAPASNTIFRFKLPTLAAALAGNWPGDWQWSGGRKWEEMPLPRVFADAVLLPNGQIVILNGAQRGVPGGGIDGGSTAKTGAYTALLYDPEAPAGQRMTELATSGIHRYYHSNALLLPSGDVWVAGSEQGDCVDDCASGGKAPPDQEYRAELLQLPYAFRPRPEITGLSSDALKYGGSVTITYAPASTYIETAVLIPPGANTHSLNMMQRAVFLKVTARAVGSLTVAIPPFSARLLNPGTYMLWINTPGKVPCKEARWAASAMEGEAHAREADEVLAYFGVEGAQGLSPAGVAQAREQYGRNELAPDEGTPLWRLVLKQFDDLLVKILLVAAVVDFVIAASSGESWLSAMVEPMVIMLILVANATVGVVTERNAEQAIEELKAYEAAAATVLREGRLQQVPAADLVPGDIVELTVGDQVPADLRLIALQCNMLRVDQSILTGESHSVEKRADAVLERGAVAQDKVNMLFSGTHVTSGRCRAVVVGTGAATAIGRIRDAMVASQDDDVVTPLKAKLDEFGTLLSKVIGVICVLVWVININHFSDPALGGWAAGALYYFKTAVALAVAAIPEGLPAVITTCLALGTRKMAALNAIVRRLPSVETLGCTTVICSDKTGTLTTNQMTVVKLACLATPGGDVAEYEVTGNTYSPAGTIADARSGKVLRPPSAQPCLWWAAMNSALCNDSTLCYQPGAGTYARIGEATELALRVFVEKVGLPGGADPAGPPRECVANAHWAAAYARTGVLEFSRDRKMMSVLVEGGGGAFLLTKGAPEAVLGRCSHALANAPADGGGAGGGAGGAAGGTAAGQVVGMSEAMRRGLLERMAQYGGAQALRCLALAYKPAPGGAARGGVITPLDEAGLTFVAMVAMHDPPRAECAAALATCRAAGIRVVVVTGDNQATAEAVCRDIGALGIDAGLDADQVTSLTGAEFDRLSPEQQVAASRSLAVFARVEPLHKLRLVELLRSQGHVVAMTGDGVNDAPALVRADIGVAMGSGTAVAKHASDMVLADDNFNTIVSAVREGRAIYNNTKQFIRYMISSNIGEVVAIFVAALLGCPEVLTPVQLLWVNLVTDGLPATALGFNRADPAGMARPPRSMREPIVNGWLFTRYLIIGLYVGLATVAGFVWWFLWAPGGPRLPWAALTHFQRCEEAAAAAAGYSCAAFADKHPRTIAMTVLVVVEMFNALNNLSEDASLLALPPWDNGWLLGAIGVSLALHGCIMYAPALARVFGITHLSAGEWAAVLWLSAPVLAVDEVLKAASRRRAAARRRGGAFGGGGGGGLWGGGGGPPRRGGGGSVGQQLALGVPLVSIQVSAPLDGGGSAGGADKSH
ncbi:CA1 [Scenedesmus sp. PABB004]|nr:CA1 [Scenedesmus sp. PABB004]